MTDKQINFTYSYKFNTIVRLSSWLYNCHNYVVSTNFGDKKSK